jgi:predicted phage terminase large subunit-like protein
MTTETIDDEDEVVAAPVKIRIKVHDDGPALWPDQFNKKSLLRIQKQLGTYFFSALYQGSPTPEGGGDFKKSWFRYYKTDGEYLKLENKTHRLNYCRRFGTCDLAFSTKTRADYTCVCAWAVTVDSDLILLDMHRERMVGDELVPACRRMVEKWDLDYMGIEDVAAQTLVVQTARKNGLAVRALKANLDKITRCIPAQIRMEAGQIWFPESHPELANLEAELLTFPNGAHDDTVDNVAYAALEVQRFGPASMPPEERERLERERIRREWEEAQQRDREARADFDNERWWADGWQ